MIQNKRVKPQKSVPPAIAIGGYRGVRCGTRNTKHETRNTN